MSEQVHFDPERAEHIMATHELPERTQVEIEAQLENLHEKAEQARAIAEESAEKSSIEKRRLEELERTEAPADEPRLVLGRELETVNLNQSLRAIRRRLPTLDQPFSRLIHQPVVRVASEATAKTVTRPSGLLGGGIVALLGTSTYLYVAKHVGFRYNYLIFTLLFVAGFFVGLALELVVWFATSSRRRAAE